MQCHLKLIHNWRRHLLFQSEFLGAPSVFVCKKCWFHQNPSRIPADVIEITISIEKTIFGKRQTILRTIYVSMYIVHTSVCKVQVFWKGHKKLKNKFPPVMTFTRKKSKKVGDFFSNFVVFSQCITYFYLEKGRE